MYLNRNEELLKVALDLLEKEIQPVAVSEIRIDEKGKKGFFTITEWADRNSPITKEEATRDFNDPRTKNIAILTGDPFVIDQDKGANEEFIGKYLDPLEGTVSVETPDSGRHFWLQSNGSIIKSSTSLLAKNIDVKGEKGIALVPPSEIIFPDGTIVAYRWINDFRNTKILEPTVELQELIKEKNNGKTDWNKFFSEENPEGVRNIKATRAIGKVLRETPQELWETEAWENIQQWNQDKNKPPLDIDELGTIFASIANKEAEKRSSKGSPDKPLSQVELLFRIIDSQEGKFQFFHDEQKSQFVRMKIEKHYEILKINSQEFKLYLSGLFYKTANELIASENLKSVLNILSARAIFDGEMHRLQNRITLHDDVILYDLCNKNWQGVKISEKGVEVIDQLPIAFRRYSHQLPQPLPVAGVDLMNYLKFFNLKNSDSEVLILVWIVTCFVPDIPHTVLYLHGVQGSAKSTMMRLLKSLIDNSSVGLLTLVNNKAELAQILSHHWLLPFDNVSDISNEISDTLCRAVSGYSFSKRELYSDEEDVIFSIKRPIAINGINMIFTRPDLLERSLLIELEPISSSKRCTEKEVLEQFEREKPAFLGAIFDVLSKSIKIRKTINLANKPRMADFVEWGCAIAEAMGYKSSEFLSAYESNLQLHNEEVINSSLPAQMIIRFMTGKSEWIGTAEDLYNKLDQLIVSQGIRTNKYNWVSSPNALGRLLNRLKPALEHFGIYVDKKYKDRTRLIFLTKKTIVAIVAKLPKSLYNDCNNGNSTDKGENKLQSMKDWLGKELD